MSHHRSHVVPFAAAAGALALATGLTLGATSSIAAPLPAGSPATSSGDHLRDLLTRPQDVVDELAKQLTGGTGVAGPDASGTGTSVTGTSGTSTAGAGAPGNSGDVGDAPLAPIGSGIKDVLGKAEQGAKDTPLAPVVPGPAPGGVLKLSINAAPLATACAQVTGSGTAVANLDVTVGGHDVSTPLIEAFPGLLAPCPSGSTPKANGADAQVADLIGACVRVTAEPPLQGSLLVLDHELVAQLTRAGVPLDRLVVPCPTAGADKGGDNGGDTGGGHDKGNDKANDTGAHHDEGGSGGDHGGASRGGEDDCVSTLNSQNTAGIVPTSVPQALPWVLLALALVGRKRLAHLAARLRQENAGAGR